MDERPDDVAGVLAGAAEEAPDRLGFAHGDVRWTYGEAAGRAARLATVLSESGVARGDVVAWIGDNTPAAALAYFGAAWAGAVLAPLHARVGRDDLRRVLAHVRAKAILVESDSREAAEALGLSTVALEGPRLEEGGAAPAIRVPRLPTDAAHLYATSGSTGTPKAVVLTHGNVVTHARLAARALALTDRDVWLHAAPMFHLADAWATFAMTLVRGLHRFVPRFDETAVLAAFADGVTVTNLVPTMWNALVRRPEAATGRYPSLRLLLSGGAAISPDLVRRVRAAFGAEYAQTYGLTETSPYLTISRLADDERSLPEDEACRLLARAGRPMPGVEVRVVGGDGVPVPADGTTVGEVVARGPTVTPGYLRDAEADARAFRGGWFATGDLARLHTDGRIELADRTGDVVNTGGEKVFTTDVERALADLPGVREVSVVGTPDPHWGQVVTAVLVLDAAGRTPPTLESVRAHARSRLAGFQMPRRVVVLEALPRTASGKVSKRAVREAAGRTEGG